MRRGSTRTSAMRGDEDDAESVRCAPVFGTNQRTDFFCWLIVHGTGGDPRVWLVAGLGVDVHPGEIHDNLCR